MFLTASASRRIVQVVGPVAVSVLVLSATVPSTLAETSRMLVIPASDGYGFDDCLSANKACGHVIADAWCEAHGMSAAVSFGRAEDVTASVAVGKPSPKIEPGAFLVNCKG